MMVYAVRAKALMVRCCVDVVLTMTRVMRCESVLLRLLELEGPLLKVFFTISATDE